MCARYIGLNDGARHKAYAWLQLVCQLLIKPSDSDTAECEPPKLSSVLQDLGPCGNSGFEA